MIPPIPNIFPVTDPLLIHLFIVPPKWSVDAPAIPPTFCSLDIDPLLMHSLIVPKVYPIIPPTDSSPDTIASFLQSIILAKLLFTIPAIPPTYIPSPSIIPLLVHFSIFPFTISYYSTTTF